MLSSPLLETHQLSRAFAYLPTLSHQPHRQSTSRCKTEGEKPSGRARVQVRRGMEICLYLDSCSTHTHADSTHRGILYRRQIGRPACTTNYPGPTRNASSGRGRVRAAVDNKRVLACTYPRPQLTPAWYPDNLDPRSSACIGQAQRSGPAMFSRTNCFFYFLPTFSLLFGTDGPRPFRCLMALLLGHASSNPS